MIDKMEQKFREAQKKRQSILDSNEAISEAKAAAEKARRDRDAAEAWASIDR